MDRAALIDKRRRKYLAQLLERYEELIEPQVSDRESNDTFKGLVRAKMNALAVDATDLMNLPDGEEINGLRHRDTRSAVPARPPFCPRSKEPMSVHAGSILTVGGNNVIDRIQSAGLGDATSRSRRSARSATSWSSTRSPASRTSRSRWSRWTSAPTSWRG
jgi:hypothetical protein